MTGCSISLSFNVNISFRHTFRVNKSDDGNWLGMVNSKVQPLKGSHIDICQESDTISQRSTTR